MSDTPSDIPQGLKGRLSSAHNRNPGQPSATEAEIVAQAQVDRAASTGPEMRTRAFDMRDRYYLPAMGLLKGRGATMVALLDVFWQVFWKSKTFRTWALQEAVRVTEARKFYEREDITDWPDWLPE